MPQYVSLADQGFWIPFQMLGQAFASGRDRRERKEDKKYDRGRQSSQDALQKSLIDAQLANFGTRQKKEGLELSALQRGADKQKSLDQFSAEPLPVAYRPGTQRESEEGPVTSFPVENPQEYFQNAPVGGERPAPMIDVDEYDVSKPLHGQSSGVKDATIRRARELKLTPEEITAALASRSQAVGGPFAPAASPGMRVSKITSGPEGNSVTQERDLGPMAVKPVRDETGAAVPGLYQTPDGKTVSAPPNVQAQKFAASQAQTARELATQVQDLQQTLSNVGDIRKLIAGGAGGPMGGSWLGQQAALAAAKVGATDPYDAQRMVEQFANKGIMELTSKLKGPLSEKELAFLTKSVPTIADTPQVWSRYLDQVEAAISKAISVKGGGSATSAPSASVGGPQAVRPTSAPPKFESMEAANAAAATLSPDQVVEIRNPATGAYDSFRWTQ